MQKMSPEERKRQMLLKQLFESHAANLLVRLRRLSRNKELSEDSLQDLFLKLGGFELDKLELIVNEKGSLGAFLHTVAKNILVDKVRLLSSQNTFYKDFNSNVFLELIDEEHHVDNQSKMERMIVFRVFLEEKPILTQEAFEWFFKGYDCVEVAHVLDCSVNTIRTWKSRTIKEFLTIL